MGAGCLKSPMDSMSLPTDPKAIKMGQLMVSLAKIISSLKELLEKKPIKFKEVWEFIGKVIEIKQQLAEQAGKQMSNDIQEITSGLTELKEKIEEPIGHPIFKIYDIVIPCASAIAGFIGIASKLYPEKQSELSNMKEGIKQFNAQLDMQRKGPYGQYELMNEIQKMQRKK